MASQKMLSRRRMVSWTFGARSSRLLFRNRVTVQVELGAVHPLRGKAEPGGHRLGELAVTGAEREDGEIQRVEKAIGVFRLGHQGNMLPGICRHPVIGEPGAFEKGENELQGVPGFVARLFGHVR
jgi:hypothetical protein